MQGRPTVLLDLGTDAEVSSNVKEVVERNKAVAMVRQTVKLTNQLTNLTAQQCWASSSIVNTDR